MTLPIASPVANSASINGAVSLSVYPESDGMPTAENTRQFRYITTIQGGLDALFRNDPNVFVAGDLYWYPAEGNSLLRLAPDVLVVFGRPKGERRSYLQWLEDNISPQVVFEILSPSNRGTELVRKFQFYAKFGVEEYYVFDPDSGELAGWLRSGAELKEIPVMQGWLSPRLQVRFEVEGVELKLFGPDGRRLASYLQVAEHLDKERQEKEAAQKRADKERQEKEIAQKRADRLAEQLKALGVEPES